jgi:hypothetical protein
LHIISYQFEAVNEGQIKDRIKIVTSDSSQPEIEVGFDAQVISETIASGKE